MPSALEQTTYHKILRVAALVLAVVVSFQSGVFSDVTARLAANTESYLANAVSVQVGISENDVNRLTGRITELEQQLVQQDERNLNIGLASVGSSERSTFVLSGILFIMLVLIVLNYALDYARQRERDNSATRQSSVA